AVDDSRLAQLQRETPQRPGDGRELRCLVVAETRVETDLRRRVPRRHQGNRADAIVLRLVDELGVRERHVDRGGQHGLDRTVAVAPGGWSRRRTQGGKCSGLDRLRKGYGESAE